jgi:energy-coupling factor transporter ATP-binding protein EcfA2
LHKKLNDYEITQLMNRHNFSLFLGKAGSGKSTLLISLLQSRPMFRGVYHNIILFCPANSRASIANDFWSQNLPDEQIYDDLNLDNLAEAYAIAEANASEGFRTLIVLDDVQSKLKGECEKMLLHMVNNRRHAGLSIWMACQTYMSIPRQVRQGLTDLFVFKVGKTEAGHIFNEQVELPSDLFQEVLAVVHKNPHDFFYINTNSRRIFSNWDELLFDKDD